MQENSTILDQLYEKLEEQKRRVAKIEAAIETLKEELDLGKSEPTDQPSTVAAPVAAIPRARRTVSRRTGKIPLREMIPMVIRERGRFLHKSEVEKGLKEGGYRGTSANISVYLGELVKNGALSRIKFGVSNNTFHYGLASFVDRSMGSPRFTSDSVQPQLLRSGKVAIKDIIWNP